MIGSRQRKLSEAREAELVAQRKFNESLHAWQNSHEPADSAEAIKLREAKENAWQVWKAAEAAHQAAIEADVRGAAEKHKAKALSLLERRWRAAEELRAAEADTRAFIERVGHDAANMSLLLGLIPCDLAGVERWRSTILHHTQLGASLANGNGAAKAR